MLPRVASIKNFLWDLWLTSVDLIKSTPPVAVKSIFYSLLDLLNSLLVDTSYKERTRMDDPLESIECQWKVVVIVTAEMR